MIAKVSHLVRINNDPAVPKSSGTEAPDEATDVASMRKLVFDKNNIVLKRYDDAALKKGKTPDFKLLKDGKLCGFCEMKSPRDDFILKAPKLGGVAIRKNLPFHRKLGSHVRNAAKQFDAENADHAHPNIVVFVSHTPEIQRRDLIATIAGLPVPGSSKRLFMLGKKMQKQVIEAASKVDLFIWIDPKTGIWQHLSPNDAKHRAAALQLLNISE